MPADAPPDTARISHTAHYTGYVWQRNGLCHPALVGLARPLAFQILRPLMWVGRLATGGIDLEAALLQRHRILDALLDAAVVDGRIQVVLELAGGLSSRGLRFATRHPSLRYVEGDLPGMVARKQARLDAAGLRLPNHRLQHINALADDGESSPAAVLAALAAEVGPDAGVAVITEGLINYFPVEAVRGMWRRFALAAAPFARAVYLSDVLLAGVVQQIPVVRFFMASLSVAARGRTQGHFADAAAAQAALQAAGYAQARLHGPAEWADTLDLPRGRRGDLIHVIEAWRQDPAG